MDFELTLQKYSCSILCSIFMAIGLDIAWRISPIVCFNKGLRWLPTLLTHNSHNHIPNEDEKLGSNQSGVRCSRL